jgi:VWFA-related protein
MLLLPPGHTSYVPKGNTGRTFILVLATIPGLWLSSPARLGAQTQQPAASPTPSPSQQQDQQKNDPNNTPEAGGPTGDIGPIAVPKRKTEEPKKEEAPREPKKVEGMPTFSLRVSAQLVTVDVGVLTKQGMFVPGLRKENFRVLEDNVPQTITSFNQTEAPITAVILAEFANNDFFYAFAYDSLVASYTFTQTLKKDDWIALITYDLKERILQDFTQDKRAIQASMRMMQPGMAMSQETNLFDALYDTIDRLETVEGRKYIILVSSGRDTFSKKTLDQVLKKVQGSKDIAIYTISTGQALRNWAESRGAMRYLCPITDFSCSTTYAQADNQLKTFSKMTGGKYYAPLFQASFRDAFVDVAQTIRNQYSLAYHPTNPAQDGTFRKIKVELVAPNGQPLQMRDEKGHDVKYSIVAREGYRAKHEVE